MAWTLLLIAGFFEIVWAATLKFTDGFTRLWPSVGTVLLGILMFDEPKNAVRLLCIAMIVLGIAGLKLSDPS